MDYIEIAATKFVIIAGIIMYVFGIIGNILNICVFTIWSFPRRRINENNINGRTNNSSLYLLTSSCANFVQILYPLLTRIVFDGFAQPKTKDNELLTCKFRYYVLHTSDFTSLTCICMATLDRYLISSREVRLRRLNATRRQTKLILLSIICFYGTLDIPVALYYEVSSVGECIISSRIYFYFYLCVLQIFLHGIFSICFLSIFGVLTYRQLKMIQQPNIQINLNINKQLSRMLLLSCISILISSVPYCIQNIYSVICTEISQDLSSYAFLFYYISALLFFTNAVSSFYVYFISTPNFRQQLKKIFRWKNFVNNRINIISNVPNHQ